MSKPALKPPAHPGAALLAIGGMSVLVAAGLEVLGFARRLDEGVAGWVAASGLDGAFRDLPAAWPWGWTVALVFGLAAGMLGSRRTWRRAVLWGSTLFLTAGWVPVLALAGYRAPVAMPLLALLWCGLWATIYAARHQEPWEGED